MVLLLVGHLQNLSPMSIASTLTLHALVLYSSHRILVPPAACEEHALVLYSSHRILLPPAATADLRLPVYPQP